MLKRKIMSEGAAPPAMAAAPVELGAMARATAAREGGWQLSISEHKRPQPKPVASVDASCIGNMERSLRVCVLNDTLIRFKFNVDTFEANAKRNMARWKEECKAKNCARASTQGVEVIVEQGDILETTMKHTQADATLYAAINMANARFPGGGYTSGCAAQEENMARRTNLHFTFDADTILHDGTDIVYNDTMRKLIGGEDGRVYLSTDPLICIKGREIRSKLHVVCGYELLGEDEIFPFLELRTAAVNVRSIMDQNFCRPWNPKLLAANEWAVLDSAQKDVIFAKSAHDAAELEFSSAKGSASSRLLRAAWKAAQEAQDGLKQAQDRLRSAKDVLILAKMKKRIRAQFLTLKERGVKHVVFSAFGCGAFGNDAHKVASLYKEVIAEFSDDLDKVVFAIYFAGHGMSNYEIFRAVLLGASAPPVEDSRTREARWASMNCEE